MHIAFTGSRHGMNPIQRQNLYDKLETIDRGPECYFMHGDCVGADETAAMLAWKVGGFLIERYPSYLKHWQAHSVYGTQRCQPTHPRTRNRIMVRKCHWLIAAPKSDEEEIYSGTWSTIRYARRLEKPITILYPSGQIGSE